jgi:hypothetical protein
VGPEPCVDAVRVEAVAAGREHLHLLPGHQRADADGAQRLVVVAGRRRRRAVQLHGQAADGVGVEAGQRRRASLRVVAVAVALAPPAEVQAERGEDDDGAQQPRQQRRRAAAHREVAVAHVPVPPPRHHHLRAPAAPCGALLRCHYWSLLAGRPARAPLPVTVCGRGTGDEDGGEAEGAASSSSRGWQATGKCDGGVVIKSELEAPGAVPFETRLPRQ